MFGLCLMFCLSFIVVSKQDNNQNMQQNEQSKEYPPLQIRILPEKKNEKRKRLQKNIIQTQLQKKQIKNNANITECCKYDCKKTFHKTHNPLLKTVQLHCLHKLHIQCACDIFINKKRKPSLPLLCPVCAFPVHHTILKDFHWAAFKDMKGGIRAAYQFKKDVLVPLAIGTQSIKEYLHQFAMIRQDKSYRDLF